MRKPNFRNNLSNIFELFILLNAHPMRKILLLIFASALTNFALAQQETKTPFEGIDQRWQNGADRRDSSVFKNMKYFSPTILIDVNYNYSFNNPIDNTVVGSTALARCNEMQLAALHFGG